MPLFEPRASRRRTSLAAGRSVAHAIGHIEGRILEHVAACGERGATAEETATALELRSATASARFSELGQAGRIIDSGRTRPTSSGRAAIVWISTEARDAPAFGASNVATDDGESGDQAGSREIGRSASGGGFV